MLHFRRLILQNWRNFQSVDVELQSRMFIIGPNAAGKSNLLDAFRFLRDLAKPGGGLQKAVSDRGGLKMIRSLAARQYPDVEIEVELQDPTSTSSEVWSYKVSLRQEKGGHNPTRLRHEMVKRGDKIVLSRPDKDDAEDALRLSQTSLEQIAANQPFREIADVFATTSYVHLVPQLVRHPELSGGTVIDRDPFGQSFLRRLAESPERTRTARLKQIGELLSVAVPQLKELKYLIDNREGGLPHLEAVYEHWRPQGARHREREFSDGTLRLIGLLWAILEDDSLLLLEEPELSLHTAVVSKLAPLIDRLNRRRRRQVFTSTHSPELLSDKGIGHAEVLILQPKGEGTDAKVASHVTEALRLMLKGISAADAALPMTGPDKIDQLLLQFGSNGEHNGRG